MTRSPDPDLLTRELEDAARSRGRIEKYVEEELPEDQDFEGKRVQQPRDTSV